MLVYRQMKYDKNIVTVLSACQLRAGRGGVAVLRCAVCGWLHVSGGGSTLGRRYGGHNRDARQHLAYGVHGSGPQVALPSLQIIMDRVIPARDAATRVQTLLGLNCMLHTVSRPPTSVCNDLAQGQELTSVMQTGGHSGDVLPR